MPIIKILQQNNLFLTLDSVIAIYV
jgi:hypothetical protein